MKKNLVALMVTVVMIAGALVGCGSQEVQTVGGNGTTAEASAVETTTEYGTDNTSVEEVTEAVVEESTEATTEETVEGFAETATEEVSVEKVEKTAEEQLAEATVIKEYHICNVGYFGYEGYKYQVYLVEDNEIRGISATETSDLFDGEAFSDYAYTIDVLTSDEAKELFAKDVNLCVAELAFNQMPAITSEVVEYNDNLGCFIKTDYTANNEIVAAELIFVEQ